MPRDRMKEAQARVNDWVVCAAEHMEYGARDSEPRAAIHRVMMRHANGLDYKMPTTIGDWQLYRMPGAGKAARDLTTKARRVVTAINRLTLGELMRFKNYYDLEG